MNCLETKSAVGLSLEEIVAKYHDWDEATVFDDDKKQDQDDEEAPREFDLSEVVVPAPTPANAEDHTIY